MTDVLPLLTPCRVSRRALSYSPFDSVRKPPGRHRRRTSSNYIYAGPRRNSEAKSSTSEGEERTQGTTTTTNKAALHVRERTVRTRQSPVEARKEREMFFPQTLPSGRYAQHNTVAQRMAYANPKIAAEVARQDAIDREYVRRLREIYDHTSPASRVDRRFFRLFTDYRDIADGDPYSDIFGRTKATEQLRTAVWQRQFEAENADVVLPYERTNFIMRRVPNWMMLKLLQIRDRGGLNSIVPLLLIVFVFFGFVIYIASLFYVPKEKMRPLDEVR